MTALVTFMLYIFYHNRKKKGPILHKRNPILYKWLRKKCCITLPEWLFQFVWGHVSDFLKLIHILLGYFSYNVCKIRISFLKMLTVLVINLVNTFKIMNGYGAGGGRKTWLGLQIQLEKSNLLYSEINNFLTKGLEVCISFYSLES